MLLENRRTGLLIEVRDAGKFTTSVLGTSQNVRFYSFTKLRKALEGEWIDVGDANVTNTKETAIRIDTYQGDSKENECR